MSENQIQPDIQQVPEAPELLNNTKVFPEIVKDSDNALPSTEQIQTTENKDVNNKVNDDIDEENDDEFSAEDFMLNPPDILKKENIHKLQVFLFVITNILQGREAAARLIKAMMIKPEDEEDETPTEPYV